MVVSSRLLEATILQSVEHGAGFLGKVGQVAAVQTDALEPLAHRLQHFLGHANGVGHAAFQHVVGVHQKRAAVGIGAGVLFKGRVLVRVEHHPGVRYRPGNGDIEHLPGQHRGGGIHAADVGGARAVDGGVDVVGAAGAEIADHAPLRRAHPQPSSYLMPDLKPHVCLLSCLFPAYKKYALSTHPRNVFIQSLKQIRVRPALRRGELFSLQSYSPEVSAGSSAVSAPSACASSPITCSSAARSSLICCASA